MADMNELQSLVDALQVSGSRPDQSTIDDIAQVIKEKLKLRMDEDGYRNLATQLANLSVSRSAQQDLEVAGGTPSKVKQSPSFSNRNENVIYSQNGSPAAPQIQRSSPHRRGRSPARSNVASNHNNTGRFRGNSPIRNFFAGGNKIPPAAAEPRPTRGHSPSPMNFFRRSAKSPEEKKEDVKLRTRDDSPGASPTRQSGKRAASPLQVQGSFYQQPPPHSFQPASPVQQPVSSRPTTPVNTLPKSRSSSPYSARPGLQEDDDDSVVSISARSPGRSFSMNNNISSSNVTSSGMSTANNSNNNSSGMSSQQPVRARAPPVHHRRSGSDTDFVHKPMQPPRALSNSPMRRFSQRTDDGDGGDSQPPAPPRAFSRSPQGRSSNTTYYDTVGSNGSKDDRIQIPDLSMPGLGGSIGAGGGKSNGGSVGLDTLFTPPPRVMPAPRMEGNGCFNGGEDPNHQQQTRLGLGPRFEPNDIRFEVGTSPPHPRSARHRNNSSRTTHKNNSVAATPRGEVFSPMEVDKITPARNDIMFQMGIGNHQPPRRPKPRRPTQAAETPLPRSTENSFDYDNTTVHALDADSVQAAHPNVDFSGMNAFINGKREEGKTYYIAENFRSSILAYTEAIKVYKEAVPGALPSDTLAVLLSNRAAGLLTIGALDAAIADCLLALQNVSMPRRNEPFSNDGGLLLKIKLHTRLARGYLKLGDHIQAQKAFTDALATADEASAFSKANHAPDVFRHHQSTITQMATESTLGQGDTKRLRDSLDRLSKCTLDSMKNLSERSKLAEVLSHVNVALSIAPGCLRLIENKVNLLVQMKRWREAAGYLERLAALTVRLDGVFVEDLLPKNPFPGVPMAQALKADFFGGARDEDPATKDMKLNSRATAEASLRLPYSLIQTYMRSLRLEERYPSADAALRALEDLVRRGMGVHDYNFLSNTFGFLPKERSKLKRTKEGRERGDELFRSQDFDLAAAEYASCLKIDSEGLPENHDGSTAGGRLHAVLHCNRAACLMALRRFNGAVEECSAALKIHSRYMKAILRRARCYTRLQRTQEAISEYKRWLDLVEDAKKTGQVPLSPCLFDGPNDVKPAEVHQTQKELDDILKAKRRAEATAREEADRRHERERSRFTEGFSSSWRSTGAGMGGAGSSAQQRRDQWYNQRASDENRHWDSFSNRGPRSNSIPRNRNTHGGARSSSNPRASSQGRPRQDPLVSPRASNADHYKILNLPHNASAEDVKKSFRKLALKYHPDKNKEEGAIDNFRRVKLAHEILCDPIKRRDYDAQLRLHRSDTL